MQLRGIIILLTNKKRVKELFYALVSTLLISMVFINNVQAKIFKCTSINGAVYYNDKPCPQGDKEKKIKNAKDVVNGYVPAASKSQPLVGADAVNGENNNPQKKLSNKKPVDSKQKKALDSNKGDSVSDATKNKAGNKQLPMEQAESAFTQKQISTTKAGSSKVTKNTNVSRPNIPKQLSPVEEEMLFIDMHAGEVNEGQ